MASRSRTKGNLALVSDPQDAPDGPRTANLKEVEDFAADLPEEFLL